MTDLGGRTTAKATMHLTITRADGRMEEVDVPVTTDLTPDEVCALIADVQARAGREGEALWPPS